MDKLCDHLFVFEPKGHIRDFNGNYTDYRDWLEEQDFEEKTKTVSRPTTADGGNDNDQKKKLSFQEKKEYESLEAEIADLESKKAELENKISSGETYHKKLTEWSADIAKINKTIDSKTERWVELADKM